MAEKRTQILVVDDEASARQALAEMLAAEGYGVDVVANGAQALQRLQTHEPDVVLTDLQMPGVDGMELLERGRPLAPHAAFVVMTAFGSIDVAVAAVKRGAENFLTKPLEMSTVSAVVERSLDRVRLSKEAARLRDAVGDRYSFGQILGSHPSMQRLLKQVGQVAPTRATVLIHGDSGTGKELIAAAVHHNSKRKQGPFVRLNCAALAESLLESELFGHERGSFTGATGRRDGRFQQADGGTLFLDEVSEIPMSVQVKLLRFLQEREFERVGGNETLRVDVRVVAATNRDLTERIQDGLFREDLYYRLNVVSLRVPPLRVRKTDIPVLAQHFLAKYAQENERHVRGFTEGALGQLLAYPWPGNVRELENAVERAVVLCEGEVIGQEDLMGSVAQASGGELGVFVPGLTMAEMERMIILRTLEAVGGSTAKAAEILDVSRRKIQYRIKEWGAVGAEDAVAADEATPRE